MSFAVEIEREAHVARPAPAPAPLRIVRVGLLGLGQVGQAVVRLASSTARLRQAGYSIRIAGALVRDVDKPRRCVKPRRLTSNPEAFLRGQYDVVIEALGAVEPAGRIVSRLLGRGVAVVTANKALVAAHGAELSALAARRGTSFRYEASALAGVPLLGTLGARPLVSDVRRLTAILNGTSNFVLSSVEAGQCTFEEAVASAQAAGLAEPDPSRDLDGVDAADKLSLLAALLGWGATTGRGLEVCGIRGLTPQDFAAARTFGGTIKPIAWAATTAHGISAFVGPAFVNARHPLSALDGTLCGIQLAGRFVDDLFFSGPGAGPDVTAATLLDDVVEAVSSRSRASERRTRLVRQPAPTVAPATAWLVRARFPGLAPEASMLTRLFAAEQLHVLRTTRSTDGISYALVAPTTRERIERALARGASLHRISSAAWRSLEPAPGEPRIATAPVVSEAVPQTIGPVR